MAAAAPSEAPWDWQKGFGFLNKHLDTFTKKYGDDSRGVEDSDSEDEDESPERTIRQILNRACKLVEKAQATQHPDLPVIVEKANELINRAVKAAYSGTTGINYLSSFADMKGTLVRDSMHSFMGMGPRGDALANAMAGLFGDLLGIRNPTPQSEFSGRTITPWMRTQQPHPQSTLLSRFRENLQFPAAATFPLANIVSQARCEVSQDWLCSPNAMEISRDGSCLAVIASGGYKNRDPMLHFWLTGQEKTEQDPLRLSLIEAPRTLALDDSRKLMFAGDRDRVKSFGWEDGKGTPTHTLNSGAHSGPLAVLPDGRLLRAGVGSALSWKIDTLDKHGPKMKRIGAGKYSYDNTWRDMEDDEMEHSTGSKPSAAVPFADKTLAVRTWHRHRPTGHMLCAEGQKQGYGCMSIDLEHGGAVVARYIGHGGSVNDFSTSDGHAGLFLTAASDGYTRLFDVRTPLPIFTFDVEKQEGPVTSAILTHIDGIPFMFTGGQRTQGIKLWDLRSNACLYELSTGNNQVDGLAWNATSNTLYAATDCEYKDWMGYHHGYRKAHIPGGDIKPPISQQRSPTYFWPDMALHTENSFGYMFDAGDQYLFRYAFKENADPNVLPEYGQGEPSAEAEFGFGGLGF